MTSPFDLVTFEEGAVVITCVGRDALRGCDAGRSLGNDGVVIDSERSVRTCVGDTAESQASVFRLRRAEQNRSMIE